MADSALLAEPASSAPRGGAGLVRVFFLADAARRLGPRACALIAWHRLRLRLGLVVLRDVTLPPGRLLPGSAPEDGLPGDAAALAAAAEAAIPPRWHGPFDAATPALALDLFAAGDIRPVWEANRLLAVPLLAFAARLAPADGHLERAEALLADWRAANPPFRGPAWACGQEAALRALHLCLALALLGGDRPTPAMRALLAAHATRIGATRAYAAAQDNNHAISEPAGLFVLGLVLGRRRMARRAARDLARAVARLVGADGSFAQASPAYHRLMLDTLCLAEWFRRRHGAAPFADPFGQRARAATAWLTRVMEPTTGALPRCGAVDDSHLADLSPYDARGTLERARALFGAEAERTPPFRPLPAAHTAPAQRAAGANAGSDAPSDRGARRQVSVSKGLWAFGGGGLEGARPPPIPTWASEGWFGAADRRFRLLLRTGAPLRFRPSQADLLHLDLALDGMPLLLDGGTGAYNPAPDDAWWTEALAGTAAHNTIQFDGQEQMPRLGRFLFARWPECRALPDGAVLRDHRGHRHERHIRLAAGIATVEDRVAGPFTRLVLRWRLAPGAWELTARGATGPRARILLTADAPFRLRLARGWHSPAYGRVEPVPVLELAAAAPVSRLATRIEAV